MSRPARLGLLVLATVAPLGAAAGCSTVDSGDLRTSGVETTITVTVGPVGQRGIDVQDSIGTGGLSTVHLEGEDRLTASSQGSSTDLDESTFLGLSDYGGRLDVGSDPGQSVTVAFERGGEDTSAPDSTVALPEATTISSPAAGSRFRISRDLTFGVNQAPGSYAVTWTGSCLVEDLAGITVDEGAPVVVPARSLQFSGGRKGPHTCAVTFTVARVVQGTLDPAYKSGSIAARRTATVGLTVVR